MQAKIEGPTVFPVQPVAKEMSGLLSCTPWRPLLHRGLRAFAWNLYGKHGTWSSHRALMDGLASLHTR